MKLTTATYNWALKHIIAEGDTDLLPTPFEFGVIKKQWTTILPMLERLDVEAHTWSGTRRLLVPKAEFSFRSVCQLDPMDALLFTALIKTVGSKIEKRRALLSQSNAFSYRFSPSVTGAFYARDNGWEAFWSRSIGHAKTHKVVLVTDITDFYNQIYHHTVENQLVECNLDRHIVKALINFLGSTTEGVSRGVPIGPHGSHLLAELSLAPLDAFISSLGLSHCRYVDDMHVFCRDEKEAQTALYKIVEYLDKTQKLQHNKAKTKIEPSVEFTKTAVAQMEDNPINAAERLILQTIRTNVADPYKKISLSKLSASDMSKVDAGQIESIFKEYIQADEIDFTRLRWFLRRLSQIGAPGGIEFIVENFPRFLPAIADAVRYLDSAKQNYKGDWKKSGKHLLSSLDLEIVAVSEYLSTVLISLFGQIKDLNHISSITKRYDHAPPACKREIVLAAHAGGSVDWLRQFKDTYKTADPWLGRAMVFALQKLPDDERKFWLRNVQKQATKTSNILGGAIAKSIA